MKVIKQDGHEFLVVWNGQKGDPSLSGYLARDGANVPTDEQRRETKKRPRCFHAERTMHTAKRELEALWET